VETTTRNNGHPFTPENKLCVVSLKPYGKPCRTFFIEYDSEPYGQKLKEIQEEIERADLLIGFAFKFDLHWLHRYGIKFSHKRIFDCQLGAFVISNQSESYPSLDDIADKYSLGRKLDVVRTQYWELGIDTPDVPRDLLQEYCEHDVALTEQVFDKQRQELTPAKRRLVAIQNEDLLFLQEAEANGLKYRLDEAAKRGAEVQQELSKIDVELRLLAGVDWINFGSSDHLSCLLYGGTIYEDFRETYTRVLKHGKTKEVTRWSKRPVHFPAICKPLDGTETVETAGMDDLVLRTTNEGRAAKGRSQLVRHYSVAEPVLKRLKPNAKGRAILAHIFRRAELTKLDSTYYSGLIAKCQEFGWPKDTIHGQFNMVVAQTGRLSSSNPNLQNFAKIIKELFYSRYA
jgi:DNA polymerase I-like protein with 3'-5' exonuclease and polymerase domains